MKTVPAALQAKLDARSSTFATCWRVDPVNATAIGFTDHDTDLTVSGLDYKSLSGYVPSKIKSTSTLSVDNLDIIGLLTDLGVTEEDVAAGVYDFAEIRIFMVDYTDTSLGEIKLKRGNVGKVSTENDFRAEFRSLTHEIQQSVGEQRTIYCRAVLGDSRCKVNLATFTNSTTVGVVTDRANFTAPALTDATGYYDYGVVTWTSGNNAGLSMEVKYHVRGGSPIATTVELTEPMPYTIQAGDGFDISAGCDRIFSTCKNKFNNVVNFRGEKDAPEVNDYYTFGGQL